MPPKRKAVGNGKSAAPPTSTRAIRSLRSRASSLAELSDARRSINKMSSKPKRTSARSTRKDPWGEEYLTTNPKSALVNVDLVKLFASPESWTCLDESEKKEILALLPEHIHPDPDPDPEDPESKIPPLPQSFLRYDNNWRCGVRQFQDDVASGRYEPKWQREAAQAVKERAEGKFDKFKEEEFEQFWGQKQKLDSSLIAGESSKVKLDTLIKHGVIQVGDTWKYSRVFGKKTERMLVEKEAKILAIDGLTLTFAIPAGQRIFLSNNHDAIEDKCDPRKVELYEEMSKSGAETTLELKSEPRKDKPQKHSDGEQILEVNDSVGTSVGQVGDHEVATETESDRKNEIEGGNMEESRFETPSYRPVPEMTKRGRGRLKRKIVTPAPEDVMVKVAIPSPFIETTISSHPLAQDPGEIAGSKVFHEEGMESMKNNATALDEPNTTVTASPTTAPEPTNVASSPTAVCAASPAEKSQEESYRDIVFPNVAGPGALGKKILKVDGRIQQPPNGNAWKEFRCYRDNQDMGSLWEVRQAWFIKTKR